jgi:hypothetical protein
VYGQGGGFKGDIGVFEGEDWVFGEKYLEEGCGY